MEERRGADGSAPVRAHRRAIEPQSGACQLLLHNIQQCSAFKRQDPAVPPPPPPSYSWPALSWLLLKPTPERARTYRAHIIISVQLRLPHLFVHLSTRRHAFGCERNHACATNPWIMYQREGEVLITFGCSMYVELIRCLCSCGVINKCLSMSVGCR